MVAVDKVDSTLASKCMDFCHALASQGQAFSFSLAVGLNFSFSLDTRSKAVKEATRTATKKKSPSTLRRNAKRREEFKKKQQASSVRQTSKDDEAVLVDSSGPKCDQCDTSFKAEEELKLHIESNHTIPVLPTPEKGRLSGVIADLTLTPVCGEGRVEVAAHPSPLPSPSPAPIPSAPIPPDDWLPRRGPNGWRDCPKNIRRRPDADGTCGYGWLFQGGTCTCGKKCTLLCFEKL